ncbi:MAG TPA: hypothetical protein VMX18_00705 [Candidatus Bipolaricaulota bacterium]|nr:hypothetical protein [Candidatus Bipolaricaulota bacterium]
MLIKWLKIVLSLAALYVFHTSLITGFFYPISAFNIFLPMLIFIMILYGEKITLIFAVVFAIFISLTSSLPFIFVMISVPFASILLIAIYNKFFTNKSLYSIIFLNFIFLLIYQSLSASLYLSYYFYVNKTVEGFVRLSFLASGFVWQLILSSIFVIIVFYLVNFISRKLKTVYLDSAT